MIITRTPVRVSFLGGGTDYPDYYTQHGGQTLGVAIDKYSYVTVKRLAPLFDHTIHVSYSRTELARSIDEILVSPTPPWVMIAGFVAGGLVRGLLVGLLVLIVSLFFTGLHLAFHNILIIFTFATLTAIVFSLAGLVNGIYAKSIDGINIVPTFVLTPLVYLGGIFYSVHSLPTWWQTITYANPLFYLINGFRYGFLGISDVSLWICLTILLVLITALIAINWYLIRTGLGLRQ